MENVNTLGGREIKTLMRNNGETIASVAARMNVTQKRVRDVRNKGVSGFLFVCDWYEGITGVNLFAQTQTVSGFNL